MKHILLLTFILLNFNLVFAKKTRDLKSMNETYRNQFHFSTEFNRLGKPISIWQNDSTYHMYFQHNPENLIDGFYNWSHATSTDLIKWDFQGSVMVQPASVTDSMKQIPWWGSVVKKDNELIAWVNRWDDGIYRTKSKDGKLWLKEEKTEGLEDLKKSDPFVFWYEPTKKWVLFAYEIPTTTMFTLTSDDGLTWKQISRFNFNFGSPQLIELNVDRKPDDTRWLMFTEKGTYMIGAFDGEKFVLETTVLKHNYGKKLGGTIVFNDKGKNRAIAITNIKGKQQADLASNGFLSLPTEITLHENQNGIELYQKPIEEINSLHLKSYYWENKKIYPGLKNNILKKVKSKQIHLKGVIDILNCDKFAFIVRSDKFQKGSEISYNVKNKIFEVLNTQFEYEPLNNKVEFEILIDRSAIEIYIDGGRYVISKSFSPKPESLRYELLCSGGEIMVEKLEAHQMKSVWREE